ncbi:hypothetical protein C0995_008423 [Termitomyces sp. Mi166|nr:hypothetical protein C0995_008423 [Termitomyces sp. Mi166\
MEDDKDEEGEATQKLRKELKDFMVLTKFDDKPLASLLPPPSEYYEEDIGLPQGAKILGGRKGDITLVSPATWVLVLEKNGAMHGCLFSCVGALLTFSFSVIIALLTIWLINVGTQLVNILAGAVVANPKTVAKACLEWQGKLSQFFILEGYKGKGKAKALLGDSEQTGTKRSFKSTELVDSDSNKEEEQDRVHVIKKIKREHVEELTGARKRKEIIELEDEEVEIVAPKTPMAGPSQQISKLVVLIPSMPKPIPKLIVALASPVAGPSTAPIVPDPASKPATTTPISNPAPVKSTTSAVKGSFIVKDPFIVRQFKLVGTEESSVLIINQVTEVPATQETLQDEESSNEDSNNKDGKGNDDDSDNDDATMDIDSAKHPEETQPTAPTKVTVTTIKAPVSVADKTKEDALFQIILY